MDAKIPGFVLRGAPHRPVESRTRRCRPRDVRADRFPVSANEHVVLRNYETTLYATTLRWAACSAVAASALSQMPANVIVVAAGVNPRAPISRRGDGNCARPDAE